MLIYTKEITDLKVIAKSLPSLIKKMGEFHQERTLSDTVELWTMLQHFHVQNEALEMSPYRIHDSLDLKIMLPLLLAHSGFSFSN